MNRGLRPRSGTDVGSLSTEELLDELDTADGSIRSRLGLTLLLGFFTDLPLLSLAFLAVVSLVGAQPVPFDSWGIMGFAAGFFGIASWIPKSMLLAARRRRLALREELDSRLQDSATAEP